MPGDPWFKPDWSPETLLTRDYVGAICVMRRALLERAGGVRVVFVDRQPRVGFDGVVDRQPRVGFDGGVERRLRLLKTEAAPVGTELPRAECATHV